MTITEHTLTKMLSTLERIEDQLRDIRAQNRADEQEPWQLNAFEWQKKMHNAPPHLKGCCPDCSPGGKFA